MTLGWAGDSVGQGESVMALLIKQYEHARRGPAVSMHIPGLKSDLVMQWCLKNARIDSIFLQLHLKSVKCDILGGRVARRGQQGCRTLSLMDSIIFWPVSQHWANMVSRLRCYATDASERSFLTKCPEINCIFTQPHLQHLSFTLKMLEPTQFSCSNIIKLPYVTACYAERDSKHESIAHSCSRMFKSHGLTAFDARVFQKYWSTAFSQSHIDTGICSFSGDSEGVCAPFPNFCPLLLLFLPFVALVWSPSPFVWHSFGGPKQAPARSRKCRRKGLSFQPKGRIHSVPLSAQQCLYAPLRFSCKLLQCQLFECSVLELACCCTWATPRELSCFAYLDDPALHAGKRCGILYRQKGTSKQIHAWQLCATLTARCKVALPSVCLSVHPSVSLSVCLSVSLSLFLFLFFLFFKSCFFVLSLSISLSLSSLLCPSICFSCFFSLSVSLHLGLSLFIKPSLRISSLLSVSSPLSLCLAFSFFVWPSLRSVLPLSQNLCSRFSYMSRLLTPSFQHPSPNKGNLCKTKGLSTGSQSPTPCGSQHKCSQHLPPPKFEFPLIGSNVPFLLEAVNNVPTLITSNHWVGAIS